MDFEKINIFSLTKFELGSKTRNRRFRFIRYTGSNYSEIVSYIHEISPNTEIWPESVLVIGTLYNYSGRDFQMNYVDDLGVRAVIVNNPYIIIDNEWVPLAMNNKEAEEYIAKDPANCVFRPSKPFSTYMKNADTGKILEYNAAEHPKGLDFVSLQPDVEYFICNSLISSAFTHTSRYDADFHELQITPDIPQIVERIERLKYQINVHSHATTKQAFFTPLWDNWKRRETMSKRCLKCEHLKSIIEIIHLSLMEETKNNGISGKNLMTYKVNNHNFVQDIKELLTCRFDCDAPTERQQDIFMRFLNNSDGPYCPNDFQKLQIGLYEDYISFLEYIISNTRKPKEGIIQEDENGNIYCCDIQLSMDFAQYKGCRCRITQYVENYIKKNNYRYFCKTIDAVYGKWQGIVELGMKGNMIVNGYLTPDHLGVDVGDAVTISCVQPNNHKRRGLYFGVVLGLDKIGVSNEENSFENSSIREFIKASDGAEFYKYLRKIIERESNKKARMMIVRAAGAAKKIVDPGHCFKQYNEEFPEMFGTKQNWSKFMQNCSNDDAEVLKLAKRLFNE